MADDLCGPSNALQKFQKHSTVDRTLQQDRLTARQPPSQGFRSADPNAGILDPEFQAFKAGQLPLLPAEAHGFQPPRHAGGMPHQTEQSRGLSNWADDFQRMNLTSQQPRQFHSAQDPSQAGWEREFLQHQAQLAGPSHPSHYNAPAERLSTLAPMPSNYQALYGRQMPIAPNMTQAQQAQQAPAKPAEVFDEEAFARAFDEAALAVAAKSAAADVTKSQAQTAAVPQEAASVPTSEVTTFSPRRIGADLIHDPDGGRTAEEEAAATDPDALSRTAGSLLERVADNTSDKFRNSQFLQFMRQVRDKEVVVDGNRMVDVHGRDIHKPEMKQPVKAPVNPNVADDVDNAAAP